MRVLFSSTRGVGHFEPLLPYAKALRARGHEVLFMGPSELREPLVTAGFEHRAFAHPGDEKLGPIWARLRSATREQANMIAVREIFAGAIAQAALPGALEIVRDWKPNVVVRDSVELASMVAAEAVGVPHARVGVHQRTVEEDVVLWTKEPVDALRAAAGLAGDHGASLESERVFTAFPEAFEGASTRPVFRIGPSKAAPNAQASWQPPTDGRPLVYVTFGTVATQSADALPVYQTALAALAELPVHALLTTGRGFDMSKLGAIPANVRVEAWVPQAEVLPHAALMVCHGGSGTLLGGLAAGVPQGVVPLFADQPQNAERLAAIGAGVALVKPDAPALSAAIERVLGEPAYRSAARAVAAEMAALPSAEAAADAMLSLASR